MSNFELQIRALLANALWKLFMVHRLASILFKKVEDGLHISTSSCMPLIFVAMAIASGKSFKKPW